jgi:hypothetical protein
VVPSELSSGLEDHVPKLIGRLFLLLLVVGLSGEFVRAARPRLSGSRRSTTSPYLNLLSQDVDDSDTAAISLYGVVKPQQEFRARGNALSSSSQRLEDEVGKQAKALQQSQISQLRPTGHQTGFQTHARFFMNNTTNRTSR